MTTTAEAAGIHCLTLSAQFAEGNTVNSYLVEGSPLTLIDTAPNTATAYVELERQLAEKSYRVEDLERIVATHHHLDHTGLMQLVAARSELTRAAFYAGTPGYREVVSGRPAVDAAVTATAFVVFMVTGAAVFGYRERTR